MPFGYPIMLEVGGRRALVVGAEAVRQGKVEALVAAGADVAIVTDERSAALDRLEAARTVRIERRAFRAEDLEGVFICVAASDDPAMRELVHREARARGVLVNVMDDVAHCDFAAPAVVRRGDLLIAIGTSGKSPALARRMREELSERYGPEWGDVLDLLAEVRGQTLEALPDLPERSRRWQAALDPDEIAQLVREGMREEARRRLQVRLVGAGAR